MLRFFFFSLILLPYSSTYVQIHICSSVGKRQNKSKPDACSDSNNRKKRKTRNRRTNREREKKKESVGEKERKRLHPFFNFLFFDFVPLRERRKKRRGRYFVSSLFSQIFFSPRVEGGVLRVVELPHVSSTASASFAIQLWFGRNKTACF